MKEITVCIVEDNHELRNALQEIIFMAEGFLCTGVMRNAEEAIMKLPNLMPDVVLMDINLGEGESGIDCVKALKPLMPSTNFMMCTIYEEDEKIFDALSAGASGYIQVLWCSLQRLLFSASSTCGSDGRWGSTDEQPDCKKSCICFQKYQHNTSDQWH